MKYFITVFVLSLLLASPVFSQNYYISPGRGVEGLIYLGEDMARIFQKWGPSNTINEGYGVLLYNYSKYQIGFGTDIVSNKVVGIYVNTYLYKTPEGLSVGTTYENVVNTYGSNYRLQSKTSAGGVGIFYDRRGIGFSILNNVVVSIVIYAPQ